MAASATKRQSDAQRTFAPPCTPNALLIVESHGRHIRHHDSEKGPDIHTGLHRCRHAEQIQLIGTGFFFGPWQAAVLEEALSPTCVALVGLAGKLLTVQTKYFAGMKREVAIVVILDWHPENGQRPIERLKAFDAESGRAMQMQASALRAHVIRVARPNETQMPGEEDARLCWIADLGEVQQIIDFAFKVSRRFSVVTSDALQVLSNIPRRIGLRVRTVRVEAIAA